MTKQLAMRASATILILFGLLIVGLLLSGITRAYASSDVKDIPAMEKANIASTMPIEESKETTAEKSDEVGEGTQNLLAANLTDAISKPAASPFVVKRILQIDEPFVHGFYAWDDEGVPAGEILVTVDLKAESLSVFRGGYEIGAAAIMYGAEEKPTPTGVFPVTEKDADHVSNLYGSPMPYMLRMTNDGISIHGSDVEYGFATHGCIGVPTPFAKLLFEQVKLGDRVIVTDGKMLGMGQKIIDG